MVLAWVLGAITAVAVVALVPAIARDPSSDAVSGSCPGITGLAGGAPPRRWWSSCP